MWWEKRRNGSFRTTCADFKYGWHRQEIPKDFWSQIQVMKIEKSFLTTVVHTKLQVRGAKKDGTGKDQLVP